MKNTEKLFLLELVKKLRRQAFSAFNERNIPKEDIILHVKDASRVIKILHKCEGISLMERGELAVFLISSFASTWMVVEELIPNNGASDELLKLMAMLVVGCEICSKHDSMFERIYSRKKGELDLTIFIRLSGVAESISTLMYLSSESS